MQKARTLLTLILFISFLFSSLINGQNTSTLLSGSWEIVDIQGMDDTKLTDDELNTLGNIWHFLSDSTFVIENQKGIFSISYQREGTKISYMGRTVSLVKKEIYQIDLLDTYKGRKVTISFRLEEPLTNEILAEAINKNSSTDSSQEKTI